MEGLVDVVVIGGGIIGCSVALELVSRGSAGEVFLLERGPFLGDGTSTRNSYVIHAGIHYPEGSLKARFCVEGNRRLYGFCARHGIPCRRTGKLVVALRPEEVPVLEGLLEQGQRNGVEGLEIVDEAGVRRWEPEIRAQAALVVPSTGVFDVARWFRVVEGLLFEAGAMVLKETPVVGLRLEEEGIVVETANRGAVRARFVVNAAGLYADEIGNWVGNRFRIYPVRGDYFMVRGPRADLVQRAVYPVPGGMGLGIHLTKLWDGTLLVGPDARPASGKEDYGTLPVLTPDGEIDFEAPDFRRFFDAVKAFFPALQEGDLRLAHCGLRPSLRAPGETGFRDFRIERDGRDPRLLHLVGIDSPGLTASPALAAYVADLIEEGGG